MAEETKQAESQASSAKARASGGGSKLWLVFCLVAVLVGAVCGFITPRLLSASSRPPETAAPPAGEEKNKPAHVVESQPSNSGDPMAYLDFDTIQVNANDPRMTRYIRAVITVGVKEADKNTVKEAIEKTRPQLRDWLNTYFASCSIEDVRGPKNHNRIRRELADGFNSRIWPDGRPLVQMVLFKEFFVQ